METLAGFHPFPHDWTGARFPYEDVAVVGDRQILVECFERREVLA